MPSVKIIVLFHMFMVWFGLSLTACTAGDPGGVKFDAAVDARQEPDVFTGCQPGQPSQPRIDPNPPRTQHQDYPFRGRAMGATTVFIEGPDGSQTADVGSDGRFCVQVTLNTDSDNQITFVGRDGDGCTSTKATASIEHLTDPGSGGEPGNEIKNVAADSEGARVSYLKGKPDQGSAVDVHDGIVETAATVIFNDPDGFGSDCDFTDDSTWIRFDFDQSYIVTQARIKWPKDVGDLYALCYKVLLTHEENAGDPNSSQDWLDVATETKGTAETQEITIIPQLARSAALVLYEDNDFGVREEFRVAEFEVDGQDPDGTPPPPPPVCP